MFRFHFVFIQALQKNVLLKSTNPIRRPTLSSKNFPTLLQLNTVLSLNSFPANKRTEMKFFQLFYDLFLLKYE